MGAKRKATLYASKVNVHEMLYNYDLSVVKAKISEALLNYIGVSIKESGSEWTFSQVKKIRAHDKDFITGYLVRGKDELLKQLEEHELEEVLFKRKGYESRFIYEPNSEVLVFQVIHNKISSNQFIYYFNRLVNSIDPNIGTLEIKPLKKSKELKQEILELSKIIYVEFNLIVPNYDASEEIIRLRRLINDAQIKKFSSKAENSKEGLKIKNSNSQNQMENTLIGDQINASIKGYGDGKIGGYKTGEGFKEINTKSKDLIESIIYESEKEFIDRMLRFIVYAEDNRNDTI